MRIQYEGEKDKMKNYHAVDSTIIKELKEIVGDHYAVNDADRLEAYKTDEEANPKYHHLPEAVVYPETTEQVAAIMKLANKYIIPVTPRSGGTGLAGGAIPVLGGIVLAFDRMNKILKLDPDNLFVRVQAGVQTIDIQNAAKEEGLMYAGDPCSVDAGCEIGGNVSTNAGGNKAVRYGTTRQQVYSVQVVTAAGEIVEFGARLKKKSTGYAMEQLIIGAEGTLGIVTEITLKLQPLPKYTSDLLAVFTNLDNALSVPNKILKEGVCPMSLEFMDTSCIQLCKKNLKVDLPDADKENVVYVIITIDGLTEDEIDQKMEKVDLICSQMGAIDMLMADQDRIWRARRDIAEATRIESLVFYAEDIVVPVDQISVLIKKLTEFENKYSIRTMTAAHIGDGNIHVHAMQCDTPNAIWNQKLDDFHNDLYHFVYSIGGKLSGEHGIGSKKIKEMKLFTDPIEMKYMKRVKKVFDPNLILNPGKIFLFEE